MQIHTYMYIHIYENKYIFIYTYIYIYLDTPFEVERFCKVRMTIAKPIATKLLYSSEPLIDAMQLCMCRCVFVRK